ncbi:phosphoribosylformylglycinamidine synthase subunit PurQ [Calorimonas adulescens]|jgi:phosphoribosylformylglycinamidine synthase subunit I (EC 6.3.5.3)|uniref:Phosphoribosylformylglycinamidine synthase subunit PurQ n=1 Tax=Calorimonas adulescens TaxID=2606906 RepID=A0A5D8QDE7_9THEO|nr:phosphoribosylformylglycinamidine synthase subunit PurQ [Calorimonas adulescens]TZE82551.1 phosphoribosylformylglycinamidine synthase subunit PurQ [Calorimonas adulescens]
MKAGVVVFPGSNCDSDCFHVLNDVAGIDTVYIWHKEERLPDVDLLVLPGGFSYGDYLRPGAMAALSPIMKDVRRFADDGGLLVGICNGFQVLCEAGLLPGVLLRNTSMKFICRWVDVTVEQETVFTRGLKGKVLRMPIAHAEGNYYADSDTLKSLYENNQIVFKYTEDVNGSMDRIAGIINRKGNVLGMMPHPERCSEEILGATDGLYIFMSALNSLGVRI